MKARSKSSAPITLVLVDKEHGDGWPYYQMYADWCSQFTSAYSSKNIAANACLVPMSQSNYAQGVQS